MHKLTIAALICATILSVAAPAGAAVPKKPAKLTIPCPDDSGKSARVWLTFDKKKDRVTKYAVDNPCSKFLAFSGEPTYASGAARNELQVAPGVHFNWAQKRLAWARSLGAYPAIGGVHWHDREECKGPTTVMIAFGYNKVRVAQDEYGDSC